MGIGEDWRQIFGSRRWLKKRIRLYLLIGERQGSPNPFECFDVACTGYKVISIIL